VQKIEVTSHSVQHKLGGYRLWCYQFPSTRTAINSPIVLELKLHHSVRLYYAVSHLGFGCVWYLLPRILTSPLLFYSNFPCSLLWTNHFLSSQAKEFPLLIKRLLWDNVTNILGLDLPAILCCCVNLYILLSLNDMIFKIQTLLSTIS
jgi:hypothetical protein